MHLFLESQFNRFLREACRATRHTPGSEICGLLVDTGLYLSFVQVRNVSPRVGGFVFSSPHVRRVVAAAKVLGQEIVGSFHSHPVGLPIPGRSDIQNTVDDSLMFIFDCLGRDGQLWNIWNDKAISLDFGLLERGRTRPNKRAGADAGFPLRLTVKHHRPGPAQRER